MCSQPNCPIFFIVIVSSQILSSCYPHLGLINVVQKTNHTAIILYTLKRTHTQTQKMKFPPLFTLFLFLTQCILLLLILLLVLNVHFLEPSRYAHAVSFVYPLAELCSCQELLGPAPKIHAQRGLFISLKKSLVVFAAKANFILSSVTLSYSNKKRHVLPVPGDWLPADYIHD